MCLTFPSVVWMDQAQFSPILNTFPKQEYNIFSYQVLAIIKKTILPFLSSYRPEPLSFYLTLAIIIIMRRNPTLPTIRESTSAIMATSKPKQPVQSFRKLEDKLNSHDEQIVKNQKIISTLANEFRLLKEQLEFEQQYNEKYKNSMGKYEEETAKQMKIIRDQRQGIAKLEHLTKEKDKALEQANKDKGLLKERCEEYSTTIDEMTRQAKRKETAIKQLETQLEKTKKELKEKESQLRQKEAEIKEGFISDRQIRESKIKKLEKDVELLNLYLQTSKEQLATRDKEIQRLNVELFQAEERIKGADKHELKAKGLIQEIRLAQKESEDLRKRMKELEEQNKSLDIALKTNESKNANGNNEKLKQLHQEKKELLEKLDKAGKEGQQAKRRLQSERRQRQKAQKQAQQSKQRLSKLESFAQRVGKGKSEIIQQLTRLKSNIQCDFCCKQLKNPVTNIPCGHSYCQECKAGYLKECKKCSGVKREAVYRNELLDQVIQAASLVEKIVTLMNG